LFGYIAMVVIAAALLPPPRGLPIIFSPQSVSGRVSCRYRTESTRELSEPRECPTWVTPQTWCRSQSTALGLRRTFAESLSVCARLMLRAPLGTAAASSAVEGGAASPPLCPARYRSQSVAACLSIVAGRILSPWGANHARPSTADQSERQQSGRAANVEMRLARAADEDRHAETNFAQLNRSTTPIRRPLARPLLCVCGGNPR
jgi:hypothetical protein